MPKPILRGAAVGALLGALALAGTASAGPSGAAFTTDVSGTVNQNHYAATTDVHLNGGPCNTPSRARLADGWYSFKVTDPSGRADLSSDPVAARTFRVKSGKIAYSTAAHPMVATPCGPVVQVGPFKAESKNGEYKLWIAPKGSGFARRKARTDNFRCDPDAASPVELPPTQEEPPAEGLPGDEAELPRPPEQKPPASGKPSDDDGPPADKPPAQTPGSDKPPAGSPRTYKPPTTKPPSTRPAGPCKPPPPPPPCTSKPRPPDPTPDPTPDPGF